MTKHPTNLLIIYINMNLSMNITQIQGIIEYIDKNVDIEPGSAMKHILVIYRAMKY